MNYIKLPWLDSEVSVFDVAQAHAQLESDYNHGGWLRERPSNKRRIEATSCQLHRMGFSMGSRWVDICNPDECNNSDDEAVRDIYLMSVLQYGLPMDDEMLVFVRQRYTEKFLSTFNISKE